jgi:hypothetical protein
MTEIQTGSQNETLDEIEEIQDPSSLQSRTGECAFHDLF